MLSTIGSALLSLAVMAAEKLLPAMIAGWMKKKEPAPAPTGLQQVRVADEASKAVDPSAKAVANDPNNLDRRGA